MSSMKRPAVSDANYAEINKFQGSTFNKRLASMFDVIGALEVGFDLQKNKVKNLEAGSEMKNEAITKLKRENSRLLDELKLLNNKVEYLDNRLSAAANEVRVSAKDSSDFERKANHISKRYDLLTESYNTVCADYKAKGIELEIVTAGLSKAKRGEEEQRGRADRYAFMSAVYGAIAVVSIVGWVWL